MKDDYMTLTIDNKEWDLKGKSIPLNVVLIGKKEGGVLLLFGKSFDSDAVEIGEWKIDEKNNFEMRIKWQEQDDKGNTKMITIKNLKPFKNGIEMIISGIMCKGEEFKCDVKFLNGPNSLYYSSTCTMKPFTLED